jgi:uncharacterized repeat protein (TIGR03803 family)
MGTDPRRSLRVFLLFLAVLVGLVANVSAQTETVLYSFSGQEDGARPLGALTFDPLGNLYGTTSQGGAQYLACQGGCGVVYELSSSPNGAWTQSVIHLFSPFNRDGGEPEAGVIFDSRGNLYGTTVSGYKGHGTVYDLLRGPGGVWKEHLIQAFGFKKEQIGNAPEGALILDSVGNLYGTTVEGGASDSGIVFQIDRSTQNVKETALYSFSGGSDGGRPSSSLTFDSQGNLFGTTTGGGDATECVLFSSRGCGVIFELSPSDDGSWRETVLHTFTGGSDGAISESNLIFDSAGNLYGTTEFGGDFSGNICVEVGCGVVFELSPNSTRGWDETVLYSFTGGPDGGQPIAGLVFDQQGNLYGTTRLGGNLSACSTSGCGVVFKLSPLSVGGWQETVLHQFGATSKDGKVPGGSVILDSEGNLYGVTTNGGDHGLGTVYRITQ